MRFFANSPVMSARRFVGAPIAVLSPPPKRFARRKLLKSAPIKVTCQPRLRHQSKSALACVSLVVWLPFSSPSVTKTSEHSSGFSSRTRPNREVDCVVERSVAAGTIWGLRTQGRPHGDGLVASHVIVDVAGVAASRM